MLFPRDIDIYVINENPEKMLLLQKYNIKVPIYIN